MLKKLVAGAVFTIASTLVMVLMGDGALVRSPVGVLYIALWISWCAVITLGIRMGAPSLFSGQLLTSILAFSAAAVLTVLPPWEYASFSGPLPRDGLLAWVGLACFAAGIFLLYWSIRELGGKFTFRIGVQPGHLVITTGPYRWVRHPGYLGYLLSFAGIGLALGSLTALVVLVSALFFLTYRLRNEEKHLLSELGEGYAYYMKQTRWRLLPGIY